jgi:hypothetical protein
MKRFSSIYRMLRNVSFLLAALAVWEFPALAQTTDTWTSTTNSSWNTAGNWDNGVPISTSNAVIGPNLTDHFSVILDTNANVNNLTLGSSGSTLTFNANQTLVVSGTLGTPLFATELDGATNINYGTLTLNSSASAGLNGNINNGTITLATNVFTIAGHTFTLNSGTLSGTGSLENNNLIQGSGTVSLNITNNGTINNNDGGTLSLSGNIQNAGGTIETISGFLNFSNATVTGGTIAGGNMSFQNETLDGVTLSGNPLQLTAGSTITVGSSGLTNNGRLGLGDGVTISGPGTLFNNMGSLIKGGGTISTNIFNNGTINSISPTSPLVLQGNITQGDIGSGIAIGSGDLVLDGANVNGGTLTSAGTNFLTAKNGAILTDVTVGQANGTVQLSGGSSLGIFGGITVQGELLLGSGAQGANLTSASATPQILLTVNSTLDGGGNVAPSIINNGSIIANNSSAALVLQGNVTGDGSILATNGATLTLDPTAVEATTFGIDPGSKLNGNGTITVPVLNNYGTLAPGLDAPGSITINGKYEGLSGSALDFELGGTGAGQFSQLDVIGTDPTGVDTFASFATGTTIDADFYGGFDPSSGCTTVFGVCESFDVLDVADGSISGLANLAFDLPALPAGFDWLALDENNDHDLVLEIEGAVSANSGGSGGSGPGGGPGSGGTNPTPEPSSLLLLAVALLSLVGTNQLRRRGSTKSLVA